MESIRLLPARSVELSSFSRTDSLSARAPSRASSATSNTWTQNTSAYVSIRQHTSAYVSIRQHTLYARLLRHIQHLDTASASLFLHLYQLLRQNLFLCTSKASTLRIYLARGRLDALQRRGACQYLYCWTSKCASICTFVLVHEGTVEQRSPSSP